MQATHKDAEQRYHELRCLALQAAERNLPSLPPYHNVTLRVFDARALAASKTWSTAASRRVDWLWFGHYASFRFRHPKRFEMAAWRGDIVQGLALGRPTYNGGALRLDVVEASPFRAKDFKLFPVSFVALSAYAALLGVDSLRIMHPVNEAVRQYYASFGMLYVARGDYMYLPL